MKIKNSKYFLIIFLVILSSALAYAADNKECRKNCRNDFRGSVEDCNDIFRNNRSNCIKDKNNALDNCKNLKGNNRADCVRNAITNFTDCNRKAVNVHRGCINISSAKLRLCLASCEKPIIVAPGFDIFETSSPNSSLSMGIPSSFFEPGSDPFSGRVEFKGEPLNPPVFGTADTIVERKESAILQGPDFNDTIPIEIVALSLVSTNPITVTYNGNASSKLWGVKVVISPSKPSNGSMKIKLNNPQGGTFNSEFFVQPKFIFERLNDNEIREFDTGSEQPPYGLNANGTPWQFEPCHPEVLRVPNFTSNFCPSSTNLGRVLTDLTGLNAQHSIKPATEFYGMKFYGCRAPTPVPLLIFNPDFNRNLTPFSQFNRTAWGNQSCGPTAAGSILNYWNRTGFPSIMGNYSLGDLIDRLRNLSGTTEENGTSVFNLVEAITKHLQNRSFARNFTVTVFENDPSQADGATIFRGKQNGVNVTAFIDNNFTFSDLTREMANETVILLLQNASGSNHFVAANDYTRTANSDGSRNISIMDPAAGAIINVVMRDNEIDFGDGVWTIITVISLSPANALLDSDNDGIPDIRDTACIDNDADGFGNACDLGDDCNDANAAINPAAPELCDGLDNDCDSGVDGGLGQTTCGFGECQRIVDNCLNGLPQECEPGIPTTEVCDGLDNNCDGAVDESFDLSSDPNNCGACGTPCSVNHIAENSCTGGQCTGTCDVGFFDCNSNKIIDGCEINILSDNNNCGACGNACHGGSFCEGGFCVSP